MGTSCGHILQVVEPYRAVRVRIENRDDKRVAIVGSGGETKKAYRYRVAVVNGDETVAPVASSRVTISVLVLLSGDVGETVQ